LTVGSIDDGTALKLCDVAPHNVEVEAVAGNLGVDRSHRKLFS
jgi:hypothetical protein